MKSKLNHCPSYERDHLYYYFAALGILLILLLILMFHPKEPSPESDPQCCIAETNISS